MDIDVLSVGPVQTNCFLAMCRNTREAILIDPGWEDQRILDMIAAHEASVKYVLNTHAHFDHMAGNALLVEKTGAVLAMHEADLPLLRGGGGADLFGIPVRPSPEPDELLQPGQILEVGELRFEVLHVPGHSPGHVAFYEAKHKALFNGDVLFHRGIGRTDLPGGDMATLTHSITQVLFNLPADVIVYCGHGPATTIGDEKTLNPWF